MKRSAQGKLHTDLPFVASRGLKSTDEGLAASSIDDMMEQTGPCDPDVVGSDTNEPADPWDQGLDDNPAMSWGKNQSESGDVSSGSISSPGGKKH